MGILSNNFLNNRLRTSELKYLLNNVFKTYKSSGSSKISNIYYASDITKPN